MSFAGQRDGKPLFHLPSTAGPDDQDGSWLSGDAVVSLSPISLLAGVLGRVARALAARARFSLDRFSDVYLVTDAIAAHAGRAAKGPRLSFAISADAQRLELTDRTVRRRERRPAVTPGAGLQRGLGAGQAQ